jgi:hypothetical protein
MIVVAHPTETRRSVPGADTCVQLVSHSLIFVGCVGGS